MFNKKFIIPFLALTMFTFGGSALARDSKSREVRRVAFKVRIENIASKEGITAQDGSRYPFALSPGFYVLTRRTFDLFKTGKRADKQLEAQAEDGNPEFFFKKYLTKFGSVNLGIFNKPLGSDMASPIFSGGAYEFTVDAVRGTKLNLAFMYGQSNDLFYAPETSIDLFDRSGNPKNGDITDLFKLWDAGTEVNQAPGLGADQGPRQKGPNTGTAENGVVKLVSDGFNYPENKSVLRVTINAQ